LVKDNRPVIWRIRLFTLSLLYLARLWDQQRGSLQKLSRNIHQSLLILLTVMTFHNPKELTRRSMNRKLSRPIFIGGLVAVIGLCLSIGLSYLPLSRIGAQSGTPSAKATMQMGNIAVMAAHLGPGSTKSNWSTVMMGIMKTSQQKDMLMTASMEVGLYTRTLVRSKLGTPDTSSASAGVEVRMVVDAGTPNERIAYPGAVIFGRRTQELTATFQGLIDGCLTVDPATGGVIIDPTCVRPEELQLVLDTMNANSFVFGLDDLGAGVHSMKLQARMVMNNTVQLGEAEARCTMGKGSMAVEEVRLVKGMQVEF
jgi:hypothetical protein